MIPDDAIIPWFTRTRRGWYYRVMVAAGAVATCYGLLTATEAAVWLGLAAVVLDVVPAAHTPTS